MLSSIFAAIGMPIINGILDKFTTLFTAYINKQITEAQLKEQLYAAMLDTIKDVEVAHAEALAKTYASFMDAMGKSVLMQHVWGAVVISQLFVLVYAQWLIPIIVLVVRWSADNPHWNYPSSGSTVEWAYLLVGALCGLGPMGLRAGPGAGSLIGQLKSLIGK